MGNNKKQSQINWEDRIFQAALVFISANSNNRDLSLWDISMGMRKAKKLIQEYKTKLEDGYFSDILE